MPTCRAVDSRDVRLHVEAWGDIRPIGSSHAVGLRMRLALSCPFCLFRDDSEFPRTLPEIETRVAGFANYHNRTQVAP